MYVSRLKQYDILSCTRLYVGVSFVLVHANVSLPVFCVCVSVCVCEYMCVCVSVCPSFLLPVERLHAWEREI